MAVMYVTNLLRQQVRTHRVTNQQTNRHECKAILGPVNHMKLVAGWYR